MKYHIERCVSHNLNGSKWEKVPGSERQDYDEAEDALVELSDTTNELLRIGRGS